MELMDFSLFNYLCKMPGYCVPEITARKFTQQIALGLLYMHSKKLAHRDLKPENILMRKIADPEEFELKLCDFGFAHSNDVLKTQIGTPEYMAPEIMVNPTHGIKYGAEVDLWALGCVVYFMLCGSLHVDKYKGPQIMNYVLSKDHIELPQNRNFSDAARSFVSKLLTRVPRDRMTFEMLRTHPFLASSMHFTLFMTRTDTPGKDASMPIIRNIVLESTDILSSKSELSDSSSSGSSITSSSGGGGITNSGNNNGGLQLLWRDVAMAFMKKAKSIEGMQESQQLLILHNGNSVDFGSPIHFNTNNYRAIEAFVFMPVVAPREVPRGFALDVPIMDINKIKEIRGIIGRGAYDYACAQREAYIFKKELVTASERYEEVMGQWKCVKQAIGCIEQVCAKYVNQYVYPALQAADGVIRGCPELAGKIIFNAPVPANTEDDIEKLFHTRWNDFLSRVNEGAIQVDRCLSSNSNDIAPYKKAFADAEASLAEYPMVITDLYTSFFSIWNTMCNLFFSIKSVFDLSDYVKGVNWTDPAEACKAFMGYNHRLHTILAANPSWSTSAFMKNGPQDGGYGARGSAGDALLKSQLGETQMKLAEAQRQVQALQAENAKLKAKVTALEQLYGQAESYIQGSQKKKI